MLSDTWSRPSPLSPSSATVPGRTAEIVIAAGSGPVLIEGPAGSGKTTLLLTRFERLVDGGTLPERIALMTPSLASADAARAIVEQQLRDGYSELVVVTPVGLAATVLRRAARHLEVLDAILPPGDRLALLAERIDELPLQHHDFGGNAGALLSGFVRRIDRLKAELIDAERFAEWAASRPQDAREREFAEIYRAHDRMVRESGGADAAGVIRLALQVLPVIQAQAARLSTCSWTTRRSSTSAPRRSRGHSPPGR